MILYIFYCGISLFKVDEMELQKKIGARKALIGIIDTRNALGIKGQREGKVWKA
jgi:hypothetical protein